ncbi:acetylserotonin O-methyltransferase [Streptomyces sp. N2-109]|uniref:Acetylserotonin O-methyltransferase n=1 Tax=Streptomyces gossypii TaxID=2883101 RepID=A0ABT2JPE6_9ACTN|nr:acetylserotonin O-methyltransferase [Streptomyces gossypii]MCT2589753.1 acetylserotonin O-methyltransferase [Streptomyces gossypii]
MTSETNNGMRVDLQASQKAIEMITGGWRAQAVYTACKLGLPDHIEKGRTTSVELAAATGAKEEGVHRLMRLLVAMGVFDGSEDSGYGNTPVSSVLLDRPGSMRDMCLLYGEEFYTAWGHAPEAISTVSAGFEVAYGKPLYEYLSQDEDASLRFQRAMKAGNLFFDYVPEIFDFSGKSVVDVGGGNGQLLASVLGATPDARGTLLDREHVVPAARENLAATIGLDRVEIVGGSMFDAVPQGGDVYTLCRVLAGWEDDDVVGVFENCRRGMADASSRLLILERVVVDDGSTVLPALWDLHLLMTNGGRHRTVERFRGMLDRAGLDLVEIAELPAETTALIAAPRA